jgi:peptide/nickel transport system substrate-binding protein
VGPAPAIPGALRGGTLTVLSGHPYTPSLDPSDNYYTDAVSIASDLLIRSLTQYVYDPGTKSMRLVPDLATDLGRHNRDYTTWTFTLRRGIRFQNGQPVTPQDVKFGIERSFDRTTFPDGAPYSNQYFLHGDTYQGPYRTPGPYPGVQVHGDTLVLKMSQPFPDLPYWASFPAISPIPPGRASDPATYKNHPWATGPYKIQNYSPGRSMVLVRNPQWDPATDPGRHQYVDKLVFDFTTPIDDGLTQRLLSDVGSAQTTILDGNLPSADYQRFKATAPDRLVLGSLPCTGLMFPDTRKITDVRVRRALAYAYPYRAAWRARGKIPGVTAKLAASSMPPGIPGRVAYTPLPGGRPSTNPVKARTLLEEAGALEFPIRFPYMVDVPEEVRWKTIMQRALTEAGFRAVPVPRRAATYGPNVLFNPDAKVNERQVGWCADWPSAGLWVQQVFGSPQSQTASGGQNSNLEQFSNHAVDARIKATELLPLAKQPEAWNALDRSIERKYLPVIPVGYAGVAYARGSKVHNDAIDSVLGMPTFKNIWLG